MHKYLPSKKFLYILLAIIIALAIIYIFSLINEHHAASLTVVSTETETKSQEFLVLDSDNDGLKDWEEALWKTDPKKTDTDGDGTSDGEEVRLNRNPVAANIAKTGETPSDQANMEVIAANKKADEEFAKLSQTQRLAQTFFSQYIASKSINGASLDNVSKQIILDTAVSMTEASNIKPYTNLDIKIIDDDSTSTLKQYGNNLTQSFFTGTGVEKVDNELVIISNAIQNQDEKILDGLDPIIEGYGRTVNKLLLISVPKNMVLLHLKLLNDLNLLKISLEEIKKMFSDPVQATVGTSRYQNTVPSLNKDWVSLRNYFISKKIIYSDKEYGYFLLNII